ncbi:hypothetical protein N0V90_011300 [Kalmusia sp. IMI 367209]|nr:hypothetical protein N0V90_011300 [Kalmusia sp. IMI 367209]
MYIQTPDKQAERGVPIRRLIFNTKVFDDADLRQKLERVNETSKAMLETALDPAEHKAIEGAVNQEDKNHGTLVKLDVSTFNNDSLARLTIDSQAQFKEALRQCPKDLIKHLPYNHLEEKEEEEAIDKVCAFNQEAAKHKSNRAILEHCTGSTAQFYVDNTMPADAIGCVLIAHVEDKKASEAWECYMNGRLEGPYGVFEKVEKSGVERRDVSIAVWAALALGIVGTVLGCA